VCFSAVKLALVCIYYAVMFREICVVRLIKTNFNIITIVNSEVAVHFISRPHFRADVVKLKAFIFSHHDYFCFAIL
jgi:hypothetical protein